MALLDGRHRSADAFAKGDTVVLYSLDVASLSKLLDEAPGLGLKIYRNFSRDLAGRLRVTTGLVRALE